MGIGAVGSGKIGCCDGFGGFSFGNGGGCCSFLMAPIIETWSRAGSFVIKLGKSMASKVSSAVSGCGEWVVIYLRLAFMDHYLSDCLN